MTINEPTPLDVLLEIRHQINKGHKQFTVYAFGSYRRQLTSMLDRQKCSFIVTDKTIHINYE